MSLTAYVDNHESLVAKVYDAGLKLYPLELKNRCTNATCHRITFMYAPLYEHANLNEATHNNLHEMFGVANMKAFMHLARLTNTGHLVDFNGGEVYMPHLDRLAIPITFIHGEQNECFLPASTEITMNDLAKANGSKSLPAARDSRLRAHRLHLWQERGEGCLSLRAGTFGGDTVRWHRHSCLCRIGRLHQPSAQAVSCLWHTFRWHQGAKMGTGAKWFGRVVWFGILLNLCFAIPAIFAPDMFLAGLDQPPETSLLWLQNVGVLLVALSIFYTPSAVAPARHPTHTKLVVLSRWISAVFWFVLWRQSAPVGVVRPLMLTDLTWEWCFYCC